MCGMHVYTRWGMCVDVCICDVWCACVMYICVWGDVCVYGVVRSLCPCPRCMECGG